jgi:hypothetical protein
MQRTVDTLKAHRADGDRHEPGDVYTTDELTARHLAGHGYVAMRAFDEDWHRLAGRELRNERLEDRRWPAVVACLNVWQDAPALRKTLPTWAPHVDAIVFADGPYAVSGKTGPSSDDLVDVLLEFADVHALHEVPMPGDAWADQPTKRTALLQDAARRYPGALLFVVDADEFVDNAQDLRDAPEGDVLWVRVTSPLYERPQSQPRLVRARPDLRYAKRHHWLYAGEQLLATHQYGGTGVEHRILEGVSLHNARGLGHSAERREVKRTIQVLQHAEERAQVAHLGAVASDRKATKRETLRIAQYAAYDAGLVGFRLHTAINATTPHASVFARPKARDVYGGPAQFDLEDPELFGRLREFAETADVVHCHLNFNGPDRFSVLPRRAVLHHHGTMYRQAPEVWRTIDALHNTVLRLVSNLELLQYGDDVHFLPNPVPVARYRRLRDQMADARPEGDRSFRVAHSPSKRDYKGTDAFLAVCAELKAKGLAIEPVLIEQESHRNALRLKATCDAAFDSFWLGIQCSGLEAGAMGLPVVAGDGHVAADARELAQVLAALATDQAYRDGEAARVSAYVERHHDEAAVALRYLDLLDEAIHWRSGFQGEPVTIPQPEPVVAPAPERPEVRPPKRPTVPEPEQPRQVAV